MQCLQWFYKCIVYTSACGMKSTSFIQIYWKNPSLLSKNTVMVTRLCITRYFASLIQFSTVIFMICSDGEWK
jgi:hypothetical protein